MKKLKYLQTIENEHLYQINKTGLSVKRVVASLYNSGEAGLSICWLAVLEGEINNVLAPIELWRKASGVETWQALLDDTKQPQTQILINPITHAKAQANEFNNHTVIKRLNIMAQKWGKPVPVGETIERFDSTALNQALDFLESEQQINWDFYSGKTKAKELFKRSDITRPETAALGQGIIYLMDKLNHDDEFIPGSLCSVSRGNGNASYIRQTGNSTFRPRRNYY